MACRDLIVESEDGASEAAVGFAVGVTIVDGEGKQRKQFGSIQFKDGPIVT